MKSVNVDNIMWTDAYLPHSLNRRVIAAVILSITVHGTVIGGWRFYGESPPLLSESRPVEVTLITEERLQTRVIPKPARTTNPIPAKTLSQTATPTTATTEEPMVEARSDVASLNNPKPPYPLAARRNQIEGLVLLAVQVNRDGLATEVTLKQTSGFAMLDNAALNTVKRWRFIPARRGNDPIDSLVEVPIRFRMEK